MICTYLIISIVFYFVNLFVDILNIRKCTVWVTWECIFIFEVVTSIPKMEAEFCFETFPSMLFLKPLDDSLLLVLFSDALINLEFIWGLIRGQNVYELWVCKCLGSRRCNSDLRLATEKKANPLRHYSSLIETIKSDSELVDRLSCPLAVTSHDVSTDKAERIQFHNYLTISSWSRTKSTLIKVEERKIAV